MSARTNDRKSMLMYVSSMLIFGSIGVFRRFIPLSSEFLAFARGLIGGLFLIAFVKLKNGKVRFHLSSQQFLWLVISGAVIGVNWIMLFEAYTYTTIATTTLCYYMAPIIVLIVSPILFREKLTTRKGTLPVIKICEVSCLHSARRCCTLLWLSSTKSLSESTLLKRRLSSCCQQEL